MKKKRNSAHIKREKRGRGERRREGEGVSRGQGRQRREGQIAQRRSSSGQLDYKSRLSRLEPGRPGAPLDWIRGNC